MFQKVLFPTDFGKPASHLLFCLGDLRKVGLKEVIIANIINTDQLNHDILISFRDQHEASLREILRIKMDEQIQTLMNLSLKPKGLIKEGIISNEIANIAESEGVSLIIFGVLYGKKDEGRLYTLISQVIYKTKVPVLVIKLTEEEIKHPEECARFCSKLFSKVLFPTDWSDCAEAALEQIKGLREIIGRIFIVHVMDERILSHLEPEKIRGYRQNDLTRLEKLEKDLSKSGLSVSTHLHVGYPAVEINRIAEEMDASLIVIGKKGKTSLTEIIWGSTSKHVLHKSNRSILVSYCCE